MYSLISWSKIGFAFNLILQLIEPSSISNFWIDYIMFSWWTKYNKWNLSCLFYRGNKYAASKFISFEMGYEFMKCPNLSLTTTKHNELVPKNIIFGKGSLRRTVKLIENSQFFPYNRIEFAIRWQHSYDLSYFCIFRFVNILGSWFT